MEDKSHLCTDRGKYWLKPFEEIPVEYILKLYFTKQVGTIYNYAKDNLDMLLDMAKTTYIAPVKLEQSTIKYDCVKIKYMTKHVANLELRRIQDAITHDHKPIRSYHCDNCNQWHLTSKSNDILAKYETVN